MTLVDDFRIVLIAMSILTVGGLIWKLAPHWREMAWGQRLFILGTICILIYAVDAHREAFMNDLGWRWRLSFFSVGIVCFACYILQPASAQQRYFKRTNKD